MSNPDDAFFDSTPRSIPNSAEQWLDSLSPASTPDRWSYFASGPPAHKGEEMQIMVVLASAWHAIHRWWKIALPIGAILGGAAAARIWWSFLPTYSSSATLMLQSHAPYIAFRGGEGLTTKANTQIQIMKTPKVLARALEDLSKFESIQKLSDPVNWLKSGLSITPVRGSELFGVNFRHTDPEIAQAVVDAVVDAYVEFSEKFDEEDTRRVISLLEAEERRRRQIISGRQEELREKNMDITGNGAHVTSEGSARLPQTVAPDLMNQLVKVDVDTELAKAELQTLEEAMTSDRQRILVPEAIAAKIESHPDVERLKTQIALRVAQLEDMDAKLHQAQESGNYRRFQRDREKTEQALQQLRDRLVQELGAESAAEDGRQREIRKQELTTQLESLAKTREVLQARLDDEATRMRKTGGTSIELEFARADLAREQEVYQVISQRIVSLKTELAAPSRLRLLEPANLPKTPTESLPFKKLLMVGFGGLLFPLALAVAWEQIQRRIGDSSQLAQSNVRVMGEVAALPHTSVLLGRRASRQSHLFEESVQSLCTRIRLARDLKQLQVLGICSAVSGEGKTSLATQLAVSVSKSLHRTTLLIDADMRSPDLCNMFEVPNEPGLAQVLQQECTCEDAIITSFSDRLHLLPAGRLTFSPHALLGSERFAEMIADLRTKYGFIIIDAPPLLSSSEALVLASAADANLLCARRNFSRAGQIREAYQRLFEADAHPIGVVLNGVPFSAYASTYGRYPAADSLADQTA